MKIYYVYILSSRSRVLYTGVTNDLHRRLYEHRHKVNKGFTARYNVEELVYFETLDDVLTAIAREKQIKGWSRKKRTDLISSTNPEWKDLAADWF